MKHLKADKNRMITKKKGGILLVSITFSFAFTFSHVSTESPVLTDPAHMVQH